jgi:hypothetical protein
VKAVKATAPTTADITASARKHFGSLTREAEIRSHEQANGFGEVADDVQHAKNVVEAFRQDVKDLGEYNAHLLLVRRIAVQRKIARGT